MQSVFLFGVLFGVSNILTLMLLAFKVMFAGSEAQYIGYLWIIQNFPESPKIILPEQGLKVNSQNPLLTPSQQFKCSDPHMVFTFTP